MEGQQVVAATYKIAGSIYTNFYGVKIITDLYSFASKYNNCTIYIDFSNLNWMDANLFALFNACVYKLRKENNVRLSADFQHLSNRFDVFFRSGAISDSQYQYVDKQGTTIPYATFYLHQEGEFYTYLESKLMCHDGLRPIPTEIKTRIKRDLNEILQNTRHANTSDPLFVCGQYYPTKGKFKLTLVDLGCGFLEPIQKFTNGIISTDLDAIRWALTGYNSTDPNYTDMAGSGLKGINSYCSTSSGTFQIFSGRAFWDSDQERSRFGSHPHTIRSFKGSVINIIFKTA